MEKVGKKLSTNITLPVVGLGVIAAKTFGDFEQELAKVNAISGATSVQFEKLKQSALDLGATTRFTSEQVAGLQLNLSKLGFNPEEINASTKGILELALATGEDLAQSATVAASTIRGFQLSVEETQRVVDVMAASFSSSALDLSKFETAMAVLAPVANTAGASIEQATGQLAVLVNAGIDASTAGTGLRNIFLDIAEKGITMDQALAKINNSSNKNATALRLFGKRGATVATVLAENIELAIEFANEFQNAGGSAQRMSKIMDETQKGSLFRMKSTLEGLAISFGDQLAPSIISVTEWVGELATYFRELSPDVKNQIILFAGLAASIGPVVLIAGTLVNSLASVTAGVRALTVAIAANPIGAIVTVVAAAAVSFGIYNSILKETVKINNELNDVEKVAIKNTAKERAQLESLFFIAKSERVSKEQRVKAIKEINKISPEYLGNLTLETINTDKARKALEKYNDVVLQTARVKAAEAKLQQIQTEIIEQQLNRAKEVGQAEKSRAEFIKAQQDLGLSYAEAVEYANDALELGNFLSDKKIDKLKEEQQLLLDIINKSGDIISLQTKGSNLTPIGAGNGGDGPNALLDLEIYDPAEIDAFIAELGGNVDKALEDAAAKTFQAKLDGFALEGTDNETVFGVSDEDVEKFILNLERVKEVATSVAGAVGEVFRGFASNIIDGLGLAESGIEGFVKNLGQTVIKLISILLSNSIANAIAGATQSALATGPGAIFSQPAFIATAVGGVLSAFAAIPKFADGGIVGGVSYTGDRLLAGVNSGELILNVAQQKNLANALQREPVVIGGDWVLSGDQIRLVLTRNGKKLDRRT